MENPSQIPVTPPQPLTPAEERQWAMFAHCKCIAEFGHRLSGCCSAPGHLHDL